MRRQFSSLFTAAFNLKTGGCMTAAIAATLILTACQQQFQTPADLLFAPTYNLGPQGVPMPWGTKYDCRSFQGTGWKGITGGVIDDLDRRWPISQAACFKTKSECKAYVRLMHGYIDQPTFMGCRPIND